MCQNPKPVMLFPNLGTSDGEMIAVYDRAFYLDSSGSLSWHTAMGLAPGSRDRLFCTITHLSTLLPFHDNLIEIRDLSSGKLKQVIEAVAPTGRTTQASGVRPGSSAFLIR
jgi:hypothetical protein